MELRPRIRREADGIRVELPPEERALLAGVAEELISALEDDAGDSAFRRLFPRAHEDEDLEQEFRELTAAELVSGRRRSLETVRRTAMQDVLTSEEADEWLRALNDLRLVLGTRLDVTEDFDWDEYERHRSAPDLALYAYLSWVQEQLVAALG